MAGKIENRECFGGPQVLKMTRAFILITLLAATANAADVLQVLGPEQASLNMSLPDGGLPPMPGVKNIEVFHASREAPDLNGGNGWTYNHHVDLAEWKGRLYLAWDSCEKDEDVGISRELYSTSSDGEHWSRPAELFPKGLSMAMRMYFFRAPSGRMLAIAGLRTSPDTTNEAKKGAMLVREILADHTLGTVYTLRPSSDAAPATIPANYSTSTDRGFIDACNQLLANKPFLEQQDYGRLLGERRMKWHDVNTWPADEPSRPHFANRFGKAMAFYHRQDGALVALMKWGWVMLSTDEGETWSPPTRPPTLVAGMAKAWGQRTSDGRYALVYNPHLEQRYPLVMVDGDDGITFKNMRVIHGQTEPMRYPGLYKVLGPQYVRGISEWSSDGSRNDKSMWIAYSVNKEHIWVSRVPIPVQKPR